MKYSKFCVYSLCFLNGVSLSGNKGMSQEGSSLPIPNPPRHILLLATSRLSFFKSKLMIWLSPLFMLMAKALRTSCSRAPLANSNSTSLGLLPFSQTWHRKTNKFMWGTQTIAETAVRHSQIQIHDIFRLMPPFQLHNSLHLRAHACLRHLSTNSHFHHVFTKI